MQLLVLETSPNHNFELSPSWLIFVYCLPPVINSGDVTAWFNPMRAIQPSTPARVDFWLNGAGKARAHTAIMSAYTAYANATGQLDKAARKSEIYTVIYLARRLRQVSPHISSCACGRLSPSQTQVTPLTPVGQDLFMQFQRPV